MTQTPADHTPNERGLELSLLQLVRMKGRGTSSGFAAALGVDEADVLDVLTRTVGSGYCKEVGSSVRLTPEGKERLAALLEEERAGVDQNRLAKLYHEFDSANSELKAIITSWQMRDEQTPNDHSDAGYDRSVIERLGRLDDGFADLLGGIVAAAPRLAHYPPRFAWALAQARAGDQKFVASPIADSYHQVWFELHEELIGLLGRTRAEEAAAGRAV